MRTKEEFVKKFHIWQIGLAFSGHVSEIKDGPMKRAEMALTIPDDMKKMLELMYDYLHTEDKKK